jgi:ankyrin repeat protein
MNTVDRALISAAWESNLLAEVDRLLSVGADVNAKDTSGFTPLHVASSEGYVQVCQALREHGADIGAKDIINGWTPLHLTCLDGQVAVVIELLIPNDSNGATSRGANIKAKDNGGNAPLHNASRKGHLPVVKALLCGGANILARNNQGRLPIHEAVSRRRSAVAKF